MLEIKRYCCRRMFLTHVEIIDHLLKYESPATMSGRKELENQSSSLSQENKT